MDDSLLAEMGDDPRAILTDGERDALKDGEVSDNYIYQVRSRVRSKIGRIEDDLDFLREHAPELADELEEVICERDSEISDLREDVKEIKESINQLGEQIQECDTGEK